MDINNSLENIQDLTFKYVEIIQPPIILTQESFDYILANIQFNYFLIIFTMGCFTSLLFCDKKYLYKKKPIVISSKKKYKETECKPILLNV